MVRNIKINQKLNSLGAINPWVELIPGCGFKSAPREISFYAFNVTSVSRAIL
jgi:hypothetical protein